MRLYIKFTVVAIVALLFSGCSLKHNLDIKSLPDYSTKQVDYQFSSIDIEVASSEEKTGDLDGINADLTTSFKNSLSNAIDDSNFFNNSSSNDINLEATILKCDGPLFGASMTVDSEISYKIENTKNDIIYNKTFKSSGTGGAFEKLIGAERWILAMDRSLKNNIKLFLEDIANTLSSPKPAVKIKKTLIEQNNDWR